MSSDVERLVREKRIRQVRVNLGPRRMAMRRLFMAEEMEPGARSLSTSRASTLMSEYNELGTFFAEFIAGRPVGNVVLDVSPPKGEGIRKFKTTSLRFWGWAEDHCNLVLVRVASKDLLKSKIIKEGEQGRKALNWMRSNNVTQVDRRPWHELFRI